MQGIGIDIIEIERIRESIEKHGDRFLNRLFTPEERAYCEQYHDPAIRFAGHFAAKEAIAKAIGTGFGEHLSWLEIHLSHDLSGKPLATYQNKNILISISHNKTQAIAIAYSL